jgi:uncharacterized protein YciW
VEPVHDRTFSASQLAIIAAVIVVVADVVDLFAALAAYREEQESSNDNKRKLEDICKYIQDKLNS